MAKCYTAGTDPNGANLRRKHPFSTGCVSLVSVRQTLAFCPGFPRFPGFFRFGHSALPDCLTLSQILLKLAPFGTDPRDDGWNRIAEWSADLQSASSPTLTKTNTWGKDLSGSMQGAGGVGGLLMVSEISNSQISNYFPTYDGNGNVSEYLNSTGTIAAHYEYDPFGKTTVATGPKAQDFAHRFSTKPLNATTGLYYYGYRYYDPNTGRWPSRDPIEEEGGINLYAFVGNDGVNRWDRLGLVGSITVPGSSQGWRLGSSNPGPGIGDQINPGGIRGDGMRNYTEWFDERFSSSLQAAKNAIKASVNTRVKALCPDMNGDPDVTSIDYGVTVEVQERYGEGGGWIQQKVQIGDLSVYIRNVSVTWDKEACSYKWSGETYVKENTGAGADDIGLLKIAHKTRLFKERTVEMEKWILTDSGSCKK